MTAMTPTAKKVEAVVSIARRIDALRRVGHITFETGHAQRIFDELWDALKALDEEANQ